MQVGHLTRKKLLDLLNQDLDEDHIEACMTGYKSKTRRASENYNKSLLHKTMSITSPKSIARGDNAFVLKDQIQKHEKLVNLTRYVTQSREFLDRNTKHQVEHTWQLKNKQDKCAEKRHRAEGIRSEKANHQELRKQ